jgi:KEOPS complex subunit Cgi121
MIHQVQNIQIFGFKSEIKDSKRLIKQIGDLVGEGTIQLLKAEGVAGGEHVMQAVLQARNAFERGENVAQDLGLEICVRASAQRQISRALQLLGIEEGKIEICAVVLDCDKNILNELEEILGKRDDEVLQPSEKTLREMYEISDQEMETLGGLERVMIERTALLTLEI